MNLIVTKQYKKPSEKFLTYLFWIAIIIYIPFGVSWSWNIYTYDSSRLFAYALHKVVGFWALVANLIVLPIGLLLRFLKEFNRTSSNP